MFKKSPRPQLYALLGGITASLLWHSPLFGGVPFILLSYLTPLPLIFIGLLYGSGLLGLAFLMMLLSTLFLHLPFSLLPLSIYTLPVLLICFQATKYRTTVNGEIEWYPTGSLLSWLLACGIFYFLSAAFFLSMGSIGLEGALEAQIERHFMQLPLLSKDSQQLEQWHTLLKNYGLSIFIVSWMVLIVLNGVLARVFLKKWFGWVQPNLTLQNLKLPSWIHFAFLLCLMLTLLPPSFKYVGKNLLLITSFPYLMVGLSLFETACAHLKISKVLKFFIYFALFFIPGALLIITVLGFIDEFFSLRQKLAKTRK